MDVPFLEDMRALGGQDVAIVGVPLDCGTTFRPGTRFGPQAIRRMSLLGTGYNPSLGVDLVEALNMVDVGDVSVIPTNLEKSFDQIDKAVSYVHELAVFPIILGGDHSIGYPDIRGLAPHVDGNIGIIHFAPTSTPSSPIPGLINRSVLIAPILPVAAVLPRASHRFCRTRSEYSHCQSRHVLHYKMFPVGYMRRLSLLSGSEYNPPLSH